MINVAIITNIKNNSCFKALFRKNHLNSCPKFNITTLNITIFFLCSEAIYFCISSEEASDDGKGFFNTNSI